MLNVLTIHRTLIIIITKKVTMGDESVNELDCADHFIMYTYIKHHIVYLIRIQFLFGNHSSIKLGKVGRT